MRALFVLLAILVARPAQAHDDLVLPKVDFSAIAIHEAGAFRSQETIHYTHGKLRIDRANGFSSTILDLMTQSQVLLMANHTYLVLPMDDELFRRYIARTTDMSGARKIGKERIEGLETTKYEFGEDGALDAAGAYWLTSAGVMLKREYEDGVFGHNVHHLELMTHVMFEKQPSSLFVVPAGYTLTR